MALPGAMSMTESVPVSPSANSTVPSGLTVTLWPPEPVLIVDVTARLATSMTAIPSCVAT